MSATVATSSDWSEGIGEQTKWNVIFHQLYIRADCWLMIKRFCESEIYFSELRNVWKKENKIYKSQ